MPCRPRDRERVTTERRQRVGPQQQARRPKTPQTVEPDDDMDLSEEEKQAASAIDLDKEMDNMSEKRNTTSNT